MTPRAITVPATPALTPAATATALCDESAAAVADVNDNFVNAAGVVAAEAVELLESLVSQTVAVTGPVVDVVVGVASPVELPPVRPRLLAVDKQQEPVPSVSQQ